MNFTNVRYLRRVNLGDYQHEEMEATAAIAEGEDDMNAMETLRNKVNAIMGVTVPDNNLSFDDTITKPQAEALGKAIEETVEEEKPKRKRAPRKPKAPKTVAYDRENKGHKDEFAAILNDKFPEWKKDKESMKAAKDLSLTLHGTPMFDDKGEILGEFTDKIVETMDMGDDL